MLLKLMCVAYYSIMIQLTYSIIRSRVGINSLY